MTGCSLEKRWWRCIFSLDDEGVFFPTDNAYHRLLWFVFKGQEKNPIPFRRRKLSCEKVTDISSARDDVLRTCYFSCFHTMKLSFILFILIYRSFFSWTIAICLVFEIKFLKNTVDNRLPLLGNSNRNVRVGSLC